MIFERRHKSGWQVAAFRSLPLGRKAHQRPLVMVQICAFSLPLEEILRISGIVLVPARARLEDGFSADLHMLWQHGPER